MRVAFNTKDVVVYSAGAGSGKTSALIKEVEEALKTYRPDEVAFTTFTKKGVATGVKRVRMLHPFLTDSDLQHFQTLHKMCFRGAGLSHRQLFNYPAVADFNKQTGCNLNLASSIDKLSTDSRLLARYDAVRSGVPMKVFDAAPYDEVRYAWFCGVYEAYKQSLHLVDFYDCLFLYLEQGEPLSCPVFILDEAQDVTDLQWRVVMKAAENAEVVRIGGDWAQAIYKYAGAGPDVLRALTEDYPVVRLDKTYRLPRKVCAVADGVLNIMSCKTPRVHKPSKDVEGSVEYVADYRTIVRKLSLDWQKGRREAGAWYCLFRTNSNMQPLCRELEAATVPYHTSRGFCLDTAVLARIKAYNRFSLRGYGAPGAREQFALKYGVEDFTKPFTESAVVAGEEKFVYQAYINEYGVDDLLEMAAGEPWCLVTTVHKVKGGEADNVAVFLDATRKVVDGMAADSDDEIRILYVACTRSRMRLYIVAAVGKFNLQPLWELVEEQMH